MGIPAFLSRPPKTLLELVAWLDMGERHPLNAFRIRQHVLAAPGGPEIETACVADSGEFTSRGVQRLFANAAAASGKTLAYFHALAPSEAAAYLDGSAPPRGDERKCPLFDRRAGILILPDGKRVALEPGEKGVLGLLVELRAARFSKLTGGHARPDQVLRILIKKYPALGKHITLPGGPGHGGYSTTIEAAE